LTRNLSVDKLRSKRHQTESIEPHLNTVSTHQNPAQLTESKDTLKSIHQLIQTLPEKQKLVLQLRDIEELSYKEIAELLEMPMNQVKVNLFRGRQSLKSALVKKEIYEL